MSSRKSLFVAGLFVVALAAVCLMGCGDDDKGTSTSPNLLSGEDYVATTSHVNGLVDSTLSVIADGLTSILSGVASDGDVVEQMPGLFYGPGVPGDGTYDDVWLVVTAASLTASGTSYYLDSLQFTVAGVPQQTSVGADHLELRHLWRVSSDDTTVTYTDYESQGQLYFDNIDGNLSTVSGTLTLEVDSKEVGATTEWKTWDVTFELNGLTVDRLTGSWSNGCPTQGEINATVTYVSQVGTADPVEVAYEYTITITDGAAAVSAVSGTKSATYNVEYCSAPTTN